MKYAIIENEVFARLNLQNIVETLRPGYQLVFTAETVADAIAGISSNSDLDLVFMDIEFPQGQNGMEAARALRRMDSTVVLIFVTNIAQMAVEGYEVDALDFIVKLVDPMPFSSR